MTATTNKTEGAKDWFEGLGPNAGGEYRRYTEILESPSHAPGPADKGLAGISADAFQRGVGQAVFLFLAVVIVLALVAIVGFVRRRQAPVRVDAPRPGLPEVARAVETEKTEKTDKGL